MLYNSRYSLGLLAFAVATGCGHRDMDGGSDQVPNAGQPHGNSPHGHQNGTGGAAPSSGGSAAVAGNGMAGAGGSNSGAPDGGLAGAGGDAGTSGAAGDAGTSGAAGDAGAPGSAGAGGGPAWWEPSCAPNPAPPLDPPTLPHCHERSYAVVTVDARASDSFSSSTPVAVNNAGQVAGTWNPGSDLEAWQAWIWSRGVRTDFHANAGIVWSFAHDMNASGAVVGRLRAPPLFQPFIYHDGVESRFLDDGRAVGINDLGDVVGVGAGKGFAYVDGVLHLLPTTSADSFTSPQSINNHRQIVGGGFGPIGSTHAFLYSCGELVDLGTLGGVTSGAIEINERGQIVGASANADGVDVPFLYENGQMLPLPAELGTQPAINNRGEIVGAGFLYAEGHLHDVRAQIVDPPCWLSFGIQDINDHGDMVALVRTCDESGDVGRDAVLLTMNPERFR